jgi:membrane protease YdiL (CAAX protease family)
MIVMLFKGKILYLNLLFLLVVGFLIGFLVLTGFSFFFQQPIFSISTQNVFEIFKIISGALLEESIFRLLLFVFLYKITNNIYVSIAIQAVCFALLHEHSNSSNIALVGYFVGGLYYCSYIFFQNKHINKYLFVCFSVGIHTGWNYFQIINTSMGSEYIFETKIESLICRVLILLLSTLFIIFYNKKVFVS